MIEWTKNLSVGNQKMDEQHIGLLKLIQYLEKSSDFGVSDEELDTVISELVNYTEQHLREEEEYLKSIGYPDFDKHVALHKFFIKRVNSFFAQFLANERNVDKEVLKFLGDWFLNHIKVEDKQYAIYSEKLTGNLSYST